MAKIFIDDKSYEVEDGQNLLHTCLTLGFDLPYFCWHPALGSVGACRQCAVKQFANEDDTQGKIVMACMTAAADDTRISIQDQEARKFRASVIEWLMVNHPHDCPVCDEGGECHLQDMTVMTGHDYREFRFKKRTHRNQYLGPFINHEMNRCIACYRCVRFYREYAGGRDFDVFGAHDHVYFGRFEDGVLQSEYSGNLVEICPTGVFTDKSLKQHYTRKWDLQTAPSICVHCGIGCNTIPGERYGKLHRILNRFNHEVNGYFLCDRGRYGYEFVNNDRRIHEPLLLKGDGKRLEPVTKDAVIQYTASLLTNENRVIGIGSPRASLESNFALRELVGHDRFYLGISDSDFKLLSSIQSILQNGPARSPSLHDAELADAVLVLGEDLSSTAPMLALALLQSIRQEPMKITEKLKLPKWDDAGVRNAIQKEKGPLFIATPINTKLDHVATKTFRAVPDDIARLGFVVANILSPDGPEVTDLSSEVQSLGDEIANALKGASRPLVISGTSCYSDAVIQAAANVAWALCKNGQSVKLCFTVPECNSFGLSLMGGKNLDDAFQAVHVGSADTVIILENDLYRRKEHAFVNAFLEAAKHVVTIDHLNNATTSKSHAVLPSGTFAEDSGTLVNNEGRAQRFYQVFAPDGSIQSSWRWIRDMMIAAHLSEAGSWESLDDISSALAKALPVFAPITDIAPPRGFRVAGEKIPRQPHRYSGRTAMSANINVHEQKPPDDPDSPLSFSMEGYQGLPPSPLIPRFWAPGWDSVQALNKFQSEVGGPLRGGDPGIRLVEPAEADKVSYFHDIPSAFEPRKDQWLIVPIHHIFGSEELSILSPGVSELAPQPYLAMNRDDAMYLECEEGQEVRLNITDAVLFLPIKLTPLRKGAIGLPVGLPELLGITFPQWCRISKKV